MNSIFNLKQPIIGLAPMDGVSDNAFRFIVKKYGNPDLIFTEFTNVMGLCIAGQNLLKAFEYDESQRPICGQIYGKEPEYFYHAAKIICALGFDGVDINMGCPAKTVSSHGSGAGLIKTPDLAREIVAAVKEGIEDWVSNGQLTGLSDRTYSAVTEMMKKYKARLASLQLEELSNESLFGRSNLIREKRIIVPVSVKTRIGYDRPITEEWIKNLDRTKPAWLSVHGRTLKQMYTGSASWDEIKIAVQSTEVPVLANGDIKNKEDLEKVLTLTGSCGALIGRGTFGNPWIFKELKDTNYHSNITLPEKIAVLIEHTEKFIEENVEPRSFVQMRKHFGWYIKGFDRAKEIREKLMRSNSLNEVKDILKSSQVEVQQ